MCAFIDSIFIITVSFTKEKSILKALSSIFNLLIFIPYFSGHYMIYFLLRTQVFYLPRYIGTRFDNVLYWIYHRFIPMYIGNTDGDLFSTEDFAVYPYVYREHKT